MPVMCGRFRCVMAADQRPLNEVVFLTVAEVATVMRVSKMTVYRLVHSGHLPAIRVGRSFRSRSKRSTTTSVSPMWGWNRPEGLKRTLGLRRRLDAG